VRLINVGPAEAIYLAPGIPVTIQVEMYDSNFNLLPAQPRTAFTWETSNAGVATITRDGIVEVQPGATPNDLAVIRVGYENSNAFVDVFAAAPPVALQLQPSSRTLTPGGRLEVRGLAQTPAGDLEGRHLFEFSLTGGENLAHLTDVGCSVDSCLPREPDAVALYPDAPGTVTITGTADGESATATFLIRTVSFTGVTTGSGHSCGLTTDGWLFCWGDGYIASPIQVVLPDGMGSIQAGVARTCGIAANGNAYCWPNSPDPVPEVVSSSISFAQLSPGPLSSCGVDIGGAAWCWGLNVTGQLGNGTLDGSDTPVAVVGGLQFQEVDTYGPGDEQAHACGITTAGAAYCWGANYLAQVGRPDGDPACEPANCWMAPMPVLAGHTFTQIVTGSAHTCALEAGGAAWCWGMRGAVGAGVPTEEGGSPPVQVLGGHAFQTLTAGGGHTCGLTVSGQAYCWGVNNSGQAGQTAASAAVLYTPTLVSGGLTFSAISAGGTHTCGLAGGILYCWGDNTTGQVGIPVGSLSQQPTRVLGQP
jgi:alpha-tubulin suppressor-like RCC1 family protein